MKLKQLRLSKGLSLEEVANEFEFLTRVNPSQIYRWENEIYLKKPSIANKLKEFYLNFDEKEYREKHPKKKMGPKVKKVNNK